MLFVAFLFLCTCAFTIPRGAVFKVRNYVMPVNVAAWTKRLIFWRMVTFWEPSTCFPDDVCFVLFASTPVMKSCLDAFSIVPTPYLPDHNISSRSESVGTGQWFLPLFIGNGWIKFQLNSFEPFYVWISSHLINRVWRSRSGKKVVKTRPSGYFSGIVSVTLLLFSTLFLNMHIICANMVVTSIISSKQDNKRFQIILWIWYALLSVKHRVEGYGRWLK